MSPITNAGSRPRASAGSGEAAARSPARRCSASRAISPGLSRDCGGSVGRSRATAPSPAAAGTSLPWARMVSRQRTVCHDSSPTTSTGVCTAVVWPRLATCVTVIVNRTVAPPRRRPPTIIGSIVTVPTTSTEAWSAASWRTGPVSRRVVCAAQAARTALTAASVNATTPHVGARVRQTRTVAQTPMAAAPTVRATLETPSTLAQTAQATRAGTSRRTSKAAGVRMAGPSLSLPEGLTRSPWVSAAPRPSRRCR